jgi:two-component system, sensor histidine kinase
MMHVHRSGARALPSSLSDHLSEILDVSPTATALIDGNDEVIWMNQAFRHLLDAEAWDGTAFALSLVVDPDAFAAVVDLRHRANHERSEQRLHVAMRTLKGVPFDGILRASIAQTGATDTLVITASPLVGVRFDHHPFRRALEVQQDLVCEWAPNGTVLYANRSYRSFFALGANVVGRKLDDMLEQRSDPPLEGMGESIRLSIIRGVEQSPDGYREDRTYPNGRTVEWTNSSVRDEANNLLSILAVGRDVTDRTATETQVRRNEERFRMMATQIWDTIALVSADGRLLDSTAPYRSDLDRPPEFWADANIIDLAHPDDRPTAVEALRHLVAMGAGAQHSVELRATRLDGSYTWLELNGTNLLAHPSVEAILLSIRNIEERKQFERERTELIARDRANLERREWFVNTVSHELRNLVHGTLGLSELLTRATLPTDVSGVVTALHRQSSGLRRVVDDLLDAAQLELHPEQVRDDVVDLDVTLADIALMFASEHVPVVFDRRERDGVLVRGDADRLRQVLMNLVRNALNHTTTGEVRLDLELTARRTARLEVRDTGTGIDASELERLFDRYERGRDEHTRGLGLGLSVARTLIERMHGQIGALSRDDGATFWIELPLSTASDPTPARGTARRHSNAPLATRLRVLVLDDDPVNRLVASMQLHELKAIAVTAETAAEAMEQLEHREFDAVLCDLNLEGESGLDFLKALRVAPVRQPFVAIMTGDADPTHHARALQAGADHFMVKPATIADVAETLARCAGAVQ